MKNCFVIMPFSTAKNGESILMNKDLDFIYKNMIQAAVDDFKLDGEKYFEYVRRYESKVGSIVKGIIQELYNADLVIADLTGLNPNVMYELGVRHALKKGTIIIAQSIESVPSDLRDYYVVLYNYSDSIHDATLNYENFKTELQKAIHQIIESSKPDSPVLDFLQRNESYIREKEAKELRELSVILKSIILEIERIDELFSEIGSKNPANTAFLFELIKHLLNNLHSKLGLLKIPPSNNFLFEDIENCRNLIYDLIQKFSVQDYFNSLQSIPENPFPSYNIQDNLNYEVIDPVYLRIKSDIRKIRIKDLFSKDEIFQKRIFEYSLDYIESEAKSIGIYKDLESFMIELNGIIHSTSEK